MLEHVDLDNVLPIYITEPEPECSLSMLNTWSSEYTCVWESYGIIRSQRLIEGSGSLGQTLRFHSRDPTTWSISVSYD